MATSRFSLFSLFFLLVVQLCCAVCPDQHFPLNPADPTSAGSFSIGVLRIDSLESTRNFSLHVFYPTNNVSSSLPVSFDIMELQPDDIAKKLKGKLPLQQCDGCFWNPAVSNLGPFPLMVFVHGLAGWYSQSLHIVNHWVSRGFIVASANYPGIYMKDFLLSTELKPVPQVDQEGDTRIILKAFETLANPQLQVFRGIVDLTRVALSGHSAGAMALQHMDDAGDVLIPMAGYGVNGKRRARSVAIFGAVSDTVVPPSNQINGFSSTTVTPKYFLLLNNSGHMAFAEACYYARDQGGFIGISEKAGVWQAYAFQDMGTQGCDYTGHKFLYPEEGWKAVYYVTSAVLEKELMCDNRMDDVLSKTSQALGGEVVQQFKEVVKQHVVEM